MKIAIGISGLSMYDAMSNDAFGMGELFNRIGHQVTYYVDNPTINKPNILPFREAKPKDIDLYIYHGWCSDEGVQLFQKLNCRKIVKYHNYTPLHFFKNEYDIYLVNKAKEHIGILVNHDEIWVDSTFNGEGLKELKRDIKYDVVPPYNQVDVLIAEPDLTRIFRLDETSTNILMVGRVVNHKNILLGIDAFNTYLQYNYNANLLISGEHDIEYSELVKTRINELILNDKVFVMHKTSLCMLKALYNMSDLLLITSKHEGFCVPIVEAMALGLPVLLTNRETSLPYTGGDAVGYSESEEPKFIAKGIKRIIENREHHIKAGQERFNSKFSNKVIDSIILKLLYRC